MQSQLRSVVAAALTACAGLIGCGGNDLAEDPAGRADRVRSSGIQHIVGHLAYVADIYSDRIGGAKSLPAPTRRLADGRDVSWRLVWLVTDMSIDPLSWDGDWQTADYETREFNGMNWFCLENVEKAPRSNRFTRVMTIESADGAYEHIRKNGWRTTLLEAPDTILLVEVVNSEVPWMASGDIDLTDLPRTINPQGKLGIGANWPKEGFRVAFVDGAVWSLSIETPFERLEKFLTVQEAGKSEREELLGSYSITRLPPTLSASDFER